MKWGPPTPPPGSAIARRIEEGRLARVEAERMAAEKAHAEEPLTGTCPTCHGRRGREAEKCLMCDDEMTVTASRTWWHTVTGGAP